jgi:hypothetical protein
MTNFDFIIDQMKFSYSNINSFHTCHYMWKLNYIDCLERKSSFFGNFGSYCHLILEKFFRDELEIWELAEYYKENYSKEITEFPPPYPANMGENYFQDGLKFFEDFEFDKSNYEILAIEDSFDTQYMGYNLVIKPDMVLKNRSNKNNILLDYKTSKLRGNEKYDKKKIDDYRKQLELYAYFLYFEKKIEINKLFLWFIRNDGRFVELNIDQSSIIDTLDWFKTTIENIKIETEWVANNTKENKFFCQQICSMRNFCKYNNI